MAGLEGDFARHGNPEKSQGGASSMKVCMMNTNYLLGGAETVMHQIANGIRAQGVSCTLAIPTLGRTLRKPLHVKLLYPRLLGRLRYTRLCGLVERLHPSKPFQNRRLKQMAGWTDTLFHVHSYTGYADIQTLAHLASGRPVLWTLHCYWGSEDLPARQDLRYEAARGLAPQMLRSPKTEAELASLHQELKPLFEAPLWITTPSASAAAAAKRCPELFNWKIHHIPNGVNTTAFSPNRKAERQLLMSLGLNPGELVVLMVNRDFKIADKGFPMALEALRAVSPGAKFQVVLVGLNAKWAASQLPEVCHAVAREFVADRDEMIRYYESADVFLFASRRENFPCVTLEAMAAGCCVVATPTDGITEQITHELNGLLAEEISGPTLIQPLQRAIVDAPLRKRLSSGARSTSEAKFSEAAMVRQFLDLYREMEGTAACR